MTFLPTWVVEGGPWAILLSLVGAFIFALSRGILVRGRELDRLERRMKDDVDRVIAMYQKQLDMQSAALILKDGVIEKQVAQIDSLMSHSAVSAHALREILEEARRRGLVS